MRGYRYLDMTGIGNCERGTPDAHAARQARESRRTMSQPADEESLITRLEAEYDAG
jgi:hypothetical protein